MGEGLRISFFFPQFQGFRSQFAPEGSLYRIVGDINRQLPVIFFTFLFIYSFIHLFIYLFILFFSFFICFLLMYIVFLNLQSTWKECIFEYQILLRHRMHVATSVNGTFLERKKKDSVLPQSAADIWSPLALSMHPVVLSLFQALGQRGRSKKRARDERDLVKKKMERAWEWEPVSIVFIKTSFRPILKRQHFKDVNCQMSVSPVSGYLRVCHHFTAYFDLLAVVLNTLNKQTNKTKNN